MVPLERLCDRARRCFPEPEGAGSRCRRYQLAVGREGHGLVTSRITLECLRGRTRHCVPEPDGIPRCRRYQLAVGRKGYGRDVSRMAFDRLRGPPVAASQSLAVSSLDADATSLPSGEKATALTQCEW